MIFVLVLTVLPLCSLCGSGSTKICNPVQYVERGNAGTIYCSFGEDSHGIYWYDTSDVTEHPMFYLEDNVKSGEGYSSGEFDVHANGSLTINNVSLSHDHNFTVVQLQRANSNPIVLTIRVVVTVHPTLLYPFIPHCNGTRYCYHYAKDSSPVVCFVNKTRPLTQLSWNLHTTNDEHEVVFHTESIQDGELFTTLITVNQSVVNYINFQVLVCKATKGEPSLINEDALVLIELLSPKVNFSEAVVENHPINETIILPCSIDESLFFVWKRRINGTNFKLLAHGAYESTVCESNQYSLKSKNALVVPFLSDELEGIYVCFYGNGTDDEMSVYNVSISGINGISSAQPRTLLSILMAVLGAIVLLSIGLVVIKRGNTRNCLNGYFSVPTKDNTGTKQVDRTSIKVSLVEQGTPAIFDLNYSSKPIENSDLKMRKCYIGTRSQPRDNKVVLFVGETGAGKTTLINALVNYLLGVTWEDDFRYHLPLVDEEKNQSHGDSQTKWISVYTFYEHRSEMSYDITIIDTPGLGGTEGESRDKKILTQIQGFILNELDHLNVIAFVNKASDLRITDRVTYVTNSIKNLFGKNLANSICLLATYASVSGNEAFIDIAKNINVGSRDPFFFNNEHLYLKKVIENYKALETQWMMGLGSFKSFTDVLSEFPDVGIELTREVVQEKMHLEKILPDFQEFLNTKVISYNKLQLEENAFLSENKQSVRGHEETYTETVKTKLSDGKMAVVCMDCETTCCYPCYHSFVTTCDSIRPLASIFGCQQCESRCSSSTHYKKDFMFEKKICKRTVTNKAMKMKLKSKNDDIIAQSVNNFQKRKDITKADIVAQVQIIRDCIERINRLSLASANITIKQILQNMITNETSKAESGWEDRVKFLKELVACEK